MTFAENHSIALGPLWIAGAKAKDIVVEDADDFDERHRGTDVTAASAFEGAHNQTAQVFRPLIERGGRRLAAAGHACSHIV